MLPRLQTRRFIRWKRWQYFVWFIRAYELQYPDVAIAISALETGWWPARSPLMRDQNLFAFRPNSRKFSVTTNANGYLIYRDFDLSIRDYMAFERQIIRRYRITTREAFIDHLARTYSRDNQYRHKLHYTLALVKHCHFDEQPAWIAD